MGRRDIDDDDLYGRIELTMSDDSARLPAVTEPADENHPDDIEPVQIVTIDMAYLGQRRLEEMVRRGDPLPNGVTPDDLVQWRSEHPDYDPTAPLCGQPIPPGVTVGSTLDRVINGMLPSGEPVEADPQPEIATDHPHTDPGDGRTECRTCGKWVHRVTHSCKGVPVTEAARQRALAREIDASALARAPAASDENLARAFNGSIASDFGAPVSDLARFEWPAVGKPEIVDVDAVEVVEPDAHCLATTARPVDAGRRCKIHADGAHHCYEGPGHQGAKRSGVVGGFVPEVRPKDPSRAPDWATHVCDCGFAWADVVQDRREPRRPAGGPVAELEG
jgi:hypothetical protein